METTTKSVTPVSIGLRYGVLAALTAVIIDFLIRIADFGFMTFGIVSFLGGVVVTIVWIVIAHKAFKDANNRLMTFSQGLIITMVMMLIISVVTSLFNYVYVQFIDPDFVNRLKTGMTEFMERNNVPDDKIAESTARFDEMKLSLPKTLVNGITRGLGVGLVLGAIVSAFTKRSAPEFE
ncbi:DUF4199 domain-containing protein [Hymenobacter sp. M29]|uniref:DUF4199 domain-containing protein n=1 Tax=Hymenobacter mellowenesis TaxID=3063995 RepID=A0ABT9ADR0_9BACT|nr:DUF4199 domain-containing protein [Hymenobacter sp. M29]MDO7847992.1 DUF4199 domain-containing protein [Hymenobacter sp. M29]